MTSTRNTDISQMANEFTFGVEIETTVKYDTCYVGEYHQGVQVPYLPEGWTAERDGSIRAPRPRIPAKSSAQS